MGGGYRQSWHRNRGAALLLAEGVAPIADGRVDLSDLMQHLRRGRYSLEPEQAPKDQGSAVATFNWDPEKTASVSLGRHKPGLYNINSVKSGDEYSSAASVFVRVYLCSQQDYPDASASFQRVRALTETWANVASGETIHSFLWAYLAELAKTSASRRP